MSQNVSDLIKLAKKHGIKHLKVGDIEFEFGDEPTKGAPRGRHVAAELSPQDEQRLKEEQMANMLIESPLAYEELLMKDN